MKIAFSHISAHTVTHTYKTLAAGTFNLLENISKKSNSSSPMSMPSDWLARPVEGPDWSLILRTDKNGYKIPGCSSWAPSLQKPEVQEAATAAAAAAKRSSSNPHLGSQCIQIHIFTRAGRGKEERGGRKKKKKNQQLSGNFSENAPKLSSASGAGDQCFCNPWGGAEWFCEPQESPGGSSELR